MSDRVPLPENIRPFTLFGITGSFVVLKTGFVIKKTCSSVTPESQPWIRTLRFKWMRCEISAARGSSSKKPPAPIATGAVSHASN
ncbi:MAG: hypothetical protein ACI9ND_002008 [Yoonia sp.]|jgi:hypothetical protein